VFVVFVAALRFRQSTEIQTARRIPIEDQNLPHRQRFFPEKETPASPSKLGSVDPNQNYFPIGFADWPLRQGATSIGVSFEKSSQWFRPNLNLTSRPLPPPSAFCASLATIVSSPPPTVASFAEMKAPPDCLIATDWVFPPFEQSGGA